MGSLFRSKSSPGPGNAPFGKAFYELENRLWRIGRGNEPHFLTHDGELMVIRSTAWRDLLVGWGQSTLQAVGECTSVIQTRVPGARITPEVSVKLWLTLNRLMRTNVFEMTGGLTRGDRSACSLAADLMYMPIFMGSEPLRMVEGSMFGSYLSLAGTQGRALRCSKDCLEILGQRVQMDTIAELAIPLAMVHTAHGNVLAESVANGEPRPLDFGTRLTHHLDTIVQGIGKH